jgi:hypothetical protein
MNLPSRLHAMMIILVLALSPLAGRAQAIDLPRGYVVAFGLSDEQGVFRSEATRAAAILTRYYGRGTRPLVYANTPASANATVANLRRALVTAASRMDRDNDVLFVFLTSHGSEAGIAVKAGRREGLLTPGQLGALLRETHVRHKVLIISACYSGIFIPLADPDTLVITAADATHPSFGCEARATWTYFGRAFFSDAVSKTADLRDAFLVARAIVSARERREGFPSSNPQMRGGDDFAAELRAAR